MDNPEVREALQSSRYNEIVVVTVEEEDDDEEVDLVEGEGATENSSSIIASSSNNHNKRKVKSKKKNEILLTPCLDEENGGIIWNQLHNPITIDNDNDNSNNSSNQPVDIGIVRHLRTKKWFLPMLNDSRRNELYETAIQNASREVVQKMMMGTTTSTTRRHQRLPIVRVLEIGAGTCLLSMMAVKYLEEAWKEQQKQEQEEQQQRQQKEQEKDDIVVRVTALEMSSAMCRLARRTITDNGLQDKITVLEKHSIEYDCCRDDDDSYNDDTPTNEIIVNNNNDDDNNPSLKLFRLCMSELLETSLLSEGIIPALRDAWDRHLLTKNHDDDDEEEDAIAAIMIPQRARVFCQIMEGSFVQSFWGPHTTTSPGTATSSNTASSQTSSSSSAAAASASENHNDGDPNNDDHDDDVDDIRLSLSANHNDVMLDGGPRGGLILPIHAEHWIDDQPQRQPQQSKPDTGTTNIGSRKRINDDTTTTTTTLSALQRHFPKRKDLLKPLSDPVQVMDFDFSGPGKLPGAEGRQAQTSIIPHTSGRVHAILFWWELDLWKNNNNNTDDDDDGRDEKGGGWNSCCCTYSTQAGKEPWQDHWHQALFIFTNHNNNNNSINKNKLSNANTETTTATTTTAKEKENTATNIEHGFHQVIAGEPCQLVTSHNDNAIWFSILKEPISKWGDDDAAIAADAADHDNEPLPAERKDQKPPPVKRIKRELQQQQQGNQSCTKGIAPLPVQLTTSPPPDQMMDTPRKKLISPQRAWQLNDNNRKLFLRRGIQAALQFKGKDAVVLDLSDFSFCAILAALEGANRVTSLESSSGAVPSISARVAQLANNLPRRGRGRGRRRRGRGPRKVPQKSAAAAAATLGVKPGLVGRLKEEQEESALFQVIQCHAENLSLRLLNGGERGEDEDGNNFGGGGDASNLDPVEVVLAEPYYEMLEGWHLQEALNYFYLTASLRKRGILSETAVSIPSLAIIRACAIQSFQLKGAYGRCGVTTAGRNWGGDDRAAIGGFDHSQANYYGDRFESHDLCLPIWQYDYVKLTSSFEIGRLCYGSGPTQRNTITRVPFQRTGTCHGILIWVDYANRAGGGQPAHAKQSTASDHSTLGWSYNQLIRMLPIPRTIGSDDDDFREYELCCHFKFGNREEDLESYKIDLQVGKRHP